MTTPIERLENELDELQDRYNKLDAFIGTTAYFAISEIQQYLLMSQRDIMKSYLSVLHTRRQFWDK